MDGRFKLPLRFRRRKLDAAVLFIVQHKGRSSSEDRKSFVTHTDAVTDADAAAIVLREEIHRLQARPNMGDRSLRRAAPGMLNVRNAIRIGPEAGKRG